MSVEASLPDKLKKLVSSNQFQYFVLAVILIAAVLVGLETYRDFAHRHHTLLTWLNNIVLWIFVAEAAIKMAQHGRQFYRYFFDPWNLFDFIIVVVCFLPINASYAAVLRLARVMRALRLMTALPKLQVIVGALIKSIPSMGYVGIVLALNFYVYAVMGVFLFSKNDPVHFKDLQTGMLSLFRVVTREKAANQRLRRYNQKRAANPPVFVDVRIQIGLFERVHPQIEEQRCAAPPRDRAKQPVLRLTAA